CRRQPRRGSRLSMLCVLILKRITSSNATSRETRRNRNPECRCIARCGARAQCRHDHGDQPCHGCAKWVHLSPVSFERRTAWPLVAHQGTVISKQVVASAREP